MGADPVLERDDGWLATDPVGPRRQSAAASLTRSFIVSSSIGDGSNPHLA
jgi:hypothetical protein